MSLTDKTEISQNTRMELGSELLMSGTKVRLRLSGNSMFPTVHANDIGIVTPISGINLEIGQVVVFASNGIWTAHRLVSIRQDVQPRVFLAQGDSVSKADNPFHEEDIVGIIETTERAGKTVSLTTPMYVRLAWLMVNFRPIPQATIRLCLKIRNRLG